MRLQRAIALMTVFAFVFALSGQTLSAADTHAVTSTQLHQAVQNSHAKAMAARQAMDNLLARPDVQSHMLRVGLAPSTVRARVAALGDDEIVRLQQQVMTASQQKATAGLSRGAIIAIVAVAVGGAIALSVILSNAISDAYSY